MLQPYESDCREPPNRYTGRPAGLGGKPDHIPSGAFGPTFEEVTANLERAHVSRVRHVTADLYRPIAEELRRAYGGAPIPTKKAVTPEVGFMQAFAENLLRHPFEDGIAWTVQGFGMMRCYVKGKKYRFNVWDSRLAVPGVSIIHDHPWDFTSWILAGEFTNVRYEVGTHEWRSKPWPLAPHGFPRRVHAAPPNYMGQTIHTGEGGRKVGAPREFYLHACQPELYSAGDTYRQRREEVHASYYADGTVTLNDRTSEVTSGWPDRARVFWPIGQEWVDAKPRSATAMEIHRTTQTALEWFQNLKR